MIIFKNIYCSSFCRGRERRKECQVSSHTARFFGGKKAKKVITTGHRNSRDYFPTFRHRSILEKKILNGFGEIGKRLQNGRMFFAVHQYNTANVTAPATSHRCSLQDAAP